VKEKVARAGPVRKPSSCPASDHPPESEDLFKLNVLLHVNRRFLKFAAKIFVVTGVAAKIMLSLMYRG
jgi:hypothetical protein